MNLIRWNWLKGLVAAVAMMVMAAGCSEASKADRAAVKTDEIRGTPINTPAVPPAQSSATTEPKPAVVPPAATTPAPSTVDGYATVGFDKLAGYTFDLPDDLLAPPSNKVAEAAQRTAQQIPAPIKAFDQKRVALRGFMLPLKVKDGLVTELLIMRDQSMCCYGAVPKINEWVSVKMTGPGVKPVMDQAVTLFGKLHVGEMRENGYLVGIYSLDGDKMATPDTL